MEKSGIPCVLRKFHDTIRNAPLPRQIQNSGIDYLGSTPPYGHWRDPLCLHHTCSRPNGPHSKRDRIR
eukprot:scaffold9072_cov106-Cylindrotheca_fusiformis.AAC.3